MSGGAAGSAASGGSQAGSATANGGASAGASGSVTAGSGGAAGAATAENATLSALVPSVGALLPVFVPTKTSYALRVPSGTTSVSLTPTASANTTAITVNGAAVASGAAAPSLAVPADGKLSVSIVASGAAPLSATTYTITLSIQAVPTHLTIYSVGDSTMADYQLSMYPHQRGWMQMFPQFLKGDVQVANFGINGTSSKSYYRSPGWDSVKGRILPGDYVFIQFGHNDEKDGGIEGASGIGTAPWVGYHDYLTKFVTEAKALGGIPILFTPVVRSSWTGTAISATGAHNLSAVGAAADSGNYPAAMRDVAQKSSCPLVDLTLLSKALAEQYGPLSAKATLYIAEDDTHLQPMGALSYAQLAAQDLLKQGILSALLEPALGLKFSDSAVNFGSRYVGSTLERSFSLYGLSLSPAAGSVKLTAPTGFTLSSGAAAPSATLELPYTLGALSPTTVTLRFAPTVPAEIASSLSVQPGTGSATSIALSATALQLPSGASEVEARYPLDATSTTACTSVGTATCAAESFAGLYPKSYADITLILPAPATVAAQRLSIQSAPVADSWPLETAQNAARYLQFSLTPASGKSARIDTVSLYTGASGGTLGLHASYSTHADFSEPVDLFDSPSNEVNVLTFRTASPVASVAPGAAFYLRVFPFSSSASTKTSLSVQSVVIHGVSY